jgi:hypothetical protein
MAGTSNEPSVKQFTVKSVRVTRISVVIVVMVMIAVTVVIMFVIVAPVPVFTPLIFVQMAIVALRIAVGFDDPLLVIHFLAVVPAMVVVVVVVVIAAFGTTEGCERQYQGEA